MNLRRPPENLPREYAEIWKALRDADERAASRQTLAIQLGVSTHTLQRILVRGDVPIFDGETRTRVVHSWTRTLSRIASRLGHDPQSWIEQVGIPWDDGIRKISAASIQEIREGRSRSGRGAPAREAESGVIRVGIVDRLALHAPLPEVGASFLEAALRRLLGSVRPEARLEVATTREEEALEALVTSPPRIDIAAGVLDVTSRRHRGLAFTPIPGWSVRLHAVGVARKEVASGISRWSAWCVPGSTIPVLASRGSAAGSYLAGASGLSTGRLRLLSTGDPAARARALVDEAQRCPEGAAVLVGDGDPAGDRSADEARRILAHDANLAGAFSMLPMEDAASAPAFPLAIATAENAPVRNDLLQRALEHEIFRVGVVATAHLYAAFASAFHRAIEDFPQANPAFRQAFCDAMVSLVRPPEYARALIPIAWQPNLDAALRGEIDPARPSVSRHQCQSCSASLDDGVHGGISDHYCRFCSDEQGRLRPREEVQGVIARWLQNWQEGIPEPEALRRAAVFMQAMPAWNPN